jgi:hypothetical protein
VQQASIDPAALGAATSHDVVDEVVKQYQSMHGGTIALPVATVASLVIDGREQVVVSAQKLPGGWFVSSIQNCEGFS